MRIVAIAGPKAVSLLLDPNSQSTIGRRTHHTLCLDHPEVSKDHCSLSYRSDQRRWFLTDTNSRHGTRVNGVSLAPQRLCPVVPGDLIEISPWTFCLMGSDGTETGASRVATIEDELVQGSAVTSIESEGGRELAQERLRLLLKCAEALQRAPDEHAMAEIVLSAAVAGTGFANAGLLRPMTPEGVIEIIQGRGEIQSDTSQPRLSRSLIRAANQGLPVQLMGSGSASVREAISIAQYQIHEAICVPLMVESTVAGYLYLDSRHRLDGGTIGVSESCAFAIGIARLASMAWANLKRLELEKRYAKMEGEISAGARAQQMILPSREGQCNGVRYIGQCKPGRVIAGDFFDIFPLPDGRVAITIGDVTGKGVPASVLMTTTQGFFHGALRQHADLGRAMRELNAYISERSDSQMFITLWAGVLDVRSQVLTYADAGHGYAWLLQQSGLQTASAGAASEDLRASSMTPLTSEGGPPIGVAPDCLYATATLAMPHGGRLLLVSDGIIEQPKRSGKAGPDHGDEFGRSRVEQSMLRKTDAIDEVTALFAAVSEHAGGPELADDATVVTAWW